MPTATDPVYMALTSSGTAVRLEIQCAHQAHVVLLVVSCPIGFAIAPRVHFMLGIDSHGVTISSFNGNEGDQFGEWHALGQKVVADFRDSREAQLTTIVSSKRFQIKTVNRQGQRKVCTTRKLHNILSVKRLDLLKSDARRNVCETCSLGIVDCIPITYVHA
jgi:uncharacterized membrane protein